MSILFKTKKWTWEVEENGINKSIFVDGNKENIVKENQYFSYLSLPGIKAVPKKNNDKSVYAGEESIVLPYKLSRDGNALKVEFKNPDLVFTLSIEEKEDTVILKTTDITPSDYEYGRFFFGCFELNEKNGDIFSSAITRNIEIQAVELPGYCVRCGAYTTHVIGDMNKACEFLICKKADLRQKIKDICKTLSVEDVVVTDKGGAFADECKEASLSYAELSGNEGLYDTESFLEKYKDLRINLFDIGHGRIFRQGDLTFLDKSMEEFKRDFVDKMHERGYKVGLHIYGSMIDDASYYVTPIPHKDLAAVDYYTLKEDLEEDSDELFIEENTQDVIMVQQHAERYPCCFGIDNEIIVFEERGENGKIYNLQRGAFGTEKTAHKKGSKIKHFARNFSHFNPLPGSELFYEIARKAAKVYNTCDMDLIYVDGLDVSHVLYDPRKLRWLPDTSYELKWYYSAKFVQEILKNCKNIPMLDYSMNAPSFWAGKSKEGSWDSFLTGYKAGIDYHCRSNEEHAHAKLLSSQLGWYELYPMAFEYSTPYYSTYVSSYEFPEDVHYLGQKVVGFDSAVATSSMHAKKHPQMDKKRKENEEVLAPYCRLKEEKYFPQEVKDMLKSEDHCYRLYEKDGKYGFIEWERHFGYPYSFNESENFFKAVNRFNDQKPFIRLLTTHTAKETEDSIVLAEFDKEIPVNKQNTYINLRPSKDTFTNVIGNEALGVWVKGNNSDEYMSIGLFGSLHAKVFMQNLIHLNFEGWRYFTLCEKDTNEATLMKFNYSEDAKQEVDSLGYHSFYQPTPCYDTLYALTIGFTGEGKDVYIGDIKAIKPKKESIKNPSIEINGEKVTFMCELEPTEYIEYRGGNTADKLDITGKVGEVEAVGTHPTLKNGENTVYLNAEASGVRRIKAYLITEDK